MAIDLEKYGNTVELEIVGSTVVSVRAVEPLDAEIALPTLPTSYAVTDAEIDRAVGAFDAALPERAGLLDAELED
jgi:hypothetical protein